MERTILTNISQLVTSEGTSARCGSKMTEVKKIRNAAVAVEDGRIAFVGTTAELMASYNTTGATVRDMSGHVLLPGFVDSHTHFIFGGYRPEEFMMRQKGVPYIEIHKAGGGIQNTVTATRNMGKDEMYRLGRKRLADMLSMGVTTVEGKSGYGLDKDCELKQLQVMKELERDQSISIATTYLGAHSIPMEYKENPENYLDFMIKEMLPMIKEKKLAEFVDVFCEEGVFSVAQAKRLLEEAKKEGFRVKMHADEIVSTKGAELAAELKAISADHLLAISEEGIKALAREKTIATLLPCTAFCLKKPYAPARTLIDSGCAVALASDYNPGSCFTNSIPLMFSLAVIHMGMTLEEALCALTLNGAAAIGREKEIGSIEVGKKADMVVLAVPQYEFLVYHTCKNLVCEVLKDGKTVYQKSEV